MRIYLTFLVLIDDFFVGIGDINSTFLPKVDPLTLSAPAQPPSSPTNLDTPPLPSPSPNSSPQTPSSVSEISSEDVIHESSPTLVGSDDEELEQRTMLTRNSIELEAQVEGRPLARKQEELEEQEQKEDVQNGSRTASKPDGKESEVDTVKTGANPQPTPHKHPAKALLRNDDRELSRVQSVHYFQFSFKFVNTNILGGISAAGRSS